ncbi:multidrug effflux MFS transporter [Aquamicrobium sp. LC103]|uniref:multidrug effflux MFS transporter n=1 Tax=Aquamicrobium sp. LC103 TaxID=1120658 RepID=UPI0014851697|nr:multidrug effflux MFS transporter [Aquamicrobium sp. LC103]
MSERRTSWLAALVGGLGPLSLALYTPAMPELGEAFAANDAAVKLTLSVYFAGFAGAQLVSGPLADRFGRKPVTLAFMALYLAGSIGAVTTFNIELFTLYRLMQGIGAAAGMVVGRAIVRDLFVGEASARVLNLSAILLGVGPAIAPAIGGLSMLVAGWRAPLILMVLLGGVSLLLVQLLLHETRPPRADAGGMGGVMRDYASIVRHPYYVWAMLTVASAVATFYAQSTVLSFIVIGQLGYSATAFGVVMLCVSGGYVLGALGLRLAAPRWDAFRLARFGVGGLMVSTIALALSLTIFPLSLAGVAVPVAMMLFSNAFVLPGMHTASLVSFPEKAGAASALTGFTTMGMGLLASVAITPFSNPAVGLATVNLVMAALAAISYRLWLKQQANSPDAA